MSTTTTKDINTAALQLPAIIIADDKALCDLVHEAASIQLVLNGAEAKQQAAVEAAKKAFADATREQSERINAIFAAIETYAAANRDRLFPKKGSKQAKTFAIMQHKLQFRSSDAVEAPTDAVEIINRLKHALAVEMAGLEGGLWQGLNRDQMEDAFEALIRCPAPELHKDAVKSASKPVRETLAAYGIKVTTSETFKLAFTFSPDQK